MKKKHDHVYRKRKLPCRVSTLVFCPFHFFFVRYSRFTLTYFSMTILRNIAQYFFLPRVHTRPQYCRILRNIDVVWTRPLYSYFHSSTILRNIAARNVRHILCHNIAQYCRRMCIAFSIENERPVHTHDNLSPDHQRRQYCAILRNIAQYCPSKLGLNCFCTHAV